MISSSSVQLSLSRCVDAGIGDSWRQPPDDICGDAEALTALDCEIGRFTDEYIVYCRGSCLSGIEYLDASSSLLDVLCD